MRTSISLIIVMSLCWCVPTTFSQEAHSADPEVHIFLEKLFRTRADILISDNKNLLSEFYLNNVKSSRSALKHELHRSKYLHAWAKQRSFNFVRTESQIRVTQMKNKEDGIAVSLVHSLKLTYTHQKDIFEPHEFGMGTRHTLFLQKKDNKWYVKREWYSDPFDENPELIPILAPESELDPDYASTKDREMGDINLSPALKTGFLKNKYNRAQALAYADKYAGAALGAGNNLRYNKNYKDYTPLGGDCTNFASQVIGDPKEGGGLKMVGNWRYWFKAGASHTWVQTDRFKNFLLYSGYGKLIFKGTYTAVMKPNEKFKEGAIHTLVPGDLIAYELSGDVDHFAVLVGFDDKGYPLVNCHTADRYHVPFDLGWDKNTTYLLIHVMD
ncbi:amidase domain-containing protein [Paenibacillus agricola]|uniref:amidase domain-containing protein n=1 Tax=Paenibacillus agricola TaxID=2716264 RepID=UPI002892E614|nr:amidase domain-containing protein [Paenibacillus agricola]